MLLLGEDGVVGFEVVFLEQFLAISNLHIELIESRSSRLSFEKREVNHERAVHTNGLPMQKTGGYSGALAIMLKEKFASC
jgi:hypothetical protein